MHDINFLITIGVFCLWLVYHLREMQILRKRLLRNFPEAEVDVVFSRSRYPLNWYLIEHSRIRKIHKRLYAGRFSLMFCLLLTLTLTQVVLGLFDL